MSTTITADSLAEWVNDLADCDSGIHWSPDLAGLIHSAPAGTFAGIAFDYGSLPFFDEFNGRRVRRRHHPWTVNQIAKLAVLPLADLDVSENHPVPLRLGQTLVGLLDCRLGPSTRADLLKILDELWDILIRPGMAYDAGDRGEWRQWQALQEEALDSIGWYG
jgi:hypothetical protein